MMALFIENLYDLEITFKINLKAGRSMRNLVVFFIVIFPVFSFAGEPLDIADLMTHRQFKEAGLDKLSPGEIESLNRWLGGFAVAKEKKEKELPQEKKESRTEKKGILDSIVISSKKDVYTIQSVSMGGGFEINNHHFEAMNKCPGFNDGDEVLFTEGSPYGMCTTARFEKPDGSASCKAWCKEE